MNKTLEEYFEELGWPEDMRNLETLILSHKGLRENTFRLFDESKKTRDELFEEYKTFFEHRVQNQYIKVDSLMKMTMEEFAEWFGR